MDMTGCTAIKKIIKQHKLVLITSKAGDTGKEVK